ncbi:Rid family hydrolase [Rhodobacter capsulatus]|uniref:Enamine deaminase RidA, house cleaning of reactive enamine intermediates, YjgF/YER057c/UK114 family n=1 Tax=Rhodobacter capsulatus TaxID=1061 RepID=A0A1G7JUS1_RHOCA|nr:Rid family hydrolase [Rhodobacter capsulatus]WER07984.1 Rid family hydrolase [Rhodobacter capsulatus]SDF28642.1 Enamine deaminase RidA, house cleaning of reactive enamine intermediates, YjgF/YER057c/UK114 family [Rhodobacter capsulatus]
MTKIVKLKSGAVLEEKSSYSRLVAVGDWIFVSNTAGRDPETKLIPEDVAAQTHQVFANIARALEAVGSGLGDVIAARVFIQDPADTPAVMAIFAEMFRGVDPALTVTCPPLGSTVYKVEIEVTAWRGAAQGAEVIRLGV